MPTRMVTPRANQLAPTFLEIAILSSLFMEFRICGEPREPALGDGLLHYQELRRHQKRAAKTVRRGAIRSPISTARSFVAGVRSAAQVSVDDLQWRIQAFASLAPKFFPKLLQ